MASDNIFSGLKVVDLASFIAGPSAAVILSDFGADVIKVEPPGNQRSGPLKTGVPFSDFIPPLLRLLAYSLRFGPAARLDANSESPWPCSMRRSSACFHANSSISQ